MSINAISSIVQGTLSRAGRARTSCAISEGGLIGGCKGVFSAFFPFFGYLVCTGRLVGGVFDLFDFQGHGLRSGLPVGQDSSMVCRERSRDFGVQA